ncbi:hypothetical protein [Morganella sp. EGD-HP17]|uniref:hypothetical protein n=1 Tax=Morganella sp. EGD-HP17 TaxID=1435146 RepID=UPI00044C3221|nr:hypothetical protein [Morganella sp. EGD-HP17]ETO44877.1 hypothetical protein X965_00675 [Morganella sp. EGD-HP17]
MKGIKKCNVSSVDNEKEMMNFTDKQKSKSLKQLQSDLNYIESFIEQCVASIPNNNDYTCAFTKSDGEVATYEDIQNLSLDDRYKMAIDFYHTNDECFKDNDIAKAIRVLYILGFRELSRAIHVLNVDYSITKYYQPKIEDIKSKIKHKKITGKGGKGRTNTHKDEVLKIASNTWDSIKNASRSSLSVKIHSYLDKKYRGIPTPRTIEEWLKKSGLDPKVVPSTNDYELIINS